MKATITSNTILKRSTGLPGIRKQVPGTFHNPVMAVSLTSKNICLFMREIVSIVNECPTFEGVFLLVSGVGGIYFRVR